MALWLILDCDQCKTSFRQQMGGWRLIGNNIQWDKVRAPPVETSPCVRHISDCLDDLKPGDHIEIQWKGSSEVPYGRFLDSLKVLCLHGNWTSHCLFSYQIFKLKNINRIIFQVSVSLVLMHVNFSNLWCLITLT